MIIITNKYPLKDRKAFPSLKFSKYNCLMEKNWLYFFQNIYPHSSNNVNGTLNQKSKNHQITQYIYLMHVPSMTQRQLKHLSIFSLLLLALSIFQIQTIIAFSFAVLLCYLYIQKVLRRHTERGLIQLLSPSMQNHLLHRSIFDIVCNLWLFEAFRFVKILAKPLIEPNHHQSAIQALDNVSPEEKNKYLVKGAFRILPESFQQMLLGRERLQKFNLYEFEIREYPKMEKQRQSQKNTDDESEREIPRLRRVVSQQTFIKIPEQSQKNLIPINSLEIQKHEVRQIQPSYIMAKDNFLKTIQKSIGMIKSIVEIQSLNTRVQKMSTGMIIKLMIVFWIILIAQIKLNKNTRQIVLKILYILTGVITVFGTVATTGTLVYKQLNSKKPQKKAIVN